MIVRATRSSVGMADDVHAPHERTFNLRLTGNSAYLRLRDAIRLIRAAGYLPYSQVWTVSSGPRPIAVIADHWPLPAMVHPEGILPEARLETTREGATSLHFELHDDVQTPPGPARIAAARALAERLLQAARIAGGVQS